MRSLAVEVPVQDGERTRRWLMERRLLRADLRISRTSDRVRLPVTGPADVPNPAASLTEAEFVPSRRRAPRRFHELLDWPTAELDRLPRAFDVVGDIVLVRLPRDLAPRAPEVGRALLRFVPHARVVGWDHGVHGTDRRRTIEAIAGTGPFRTIHHENGLVLEVDLERAYFSPRLAREHARVAEMIRSGERVFDLCCGIGPFSLLAARDGRASEVVAVDQNAEAIALLNRNRGRLRSRVPVETHVEDLGDFLSRATRADRAILNLPLEGIKYLTSVARVVSPAGALHFYDVSRRSESTERARVVLESLLAGSSAWTIEGSRRVHPYAPDMDLVAYDCRRLRQ